jgi:hypothetical protein
MSANDEPHGPDRHGLGKSYFVQNTTTQARMISIMIADPWVIAACSAMLKLFCRLLRVGPLSVTQACSVVFIDLVEAGSPDSATSVAPRPLALL